MDDGSQTGLRGPLQGDWLRAASPRTVTRSLGASGQGPCSAQGGAGRGRGLQLAAASAEGQQRSRASYAPPGLGDGGQQHVPYGAGGPRVDGNSRAHCCHRVQFPLRPAPGVSRPSSTSCGTYRTSRTLDQSHTNRWLLAHPADLPPLPHLHCLPRPPPSPSTPGPRRRVRGAHVRQRGPLCASGPGAGGAGQRGGVGAPGGGAGGGAAKGGRPGGGFHGAHAAAAAAGQGPGGQGSLRDGAFGLVGRGRVSKLVESMAPAGAGAGRWTFLAAGSAFRAAAPEAGDGALAGCQHHQRLLVMSIRHVGLWPWR